MSKLLSINFLLLETARHINIPSTKYIVKCADLRTIKLNCSDNSKMRASLKFLNKNPRIFRVSPPLNCDESTAV